MRWLKAMDEMTGESQRVDPRGYMRLFPHHVQDSGISIRSPVTVTGIEFTSMCEHHLLPYTGVATVTYLPGRWVLGLSKFARIVEHFSRSLTIQEQLGKDISDFLVENIRECLAVGIRIESKHSCMTCRGALQRNAEMVTTSISLSSQLSEPAEPAYDISTIVSSVSQALSLRG